MCVFVGFDFGIVVCVVGFVELGVGVYGYLVWVVGCVVG